MFKLDILAVNFILNLFPWSNYALYGFGIYAKFILLLLFGQQAFNIVYAAKYKKGGKKNVS